MGFAKNLDITVWMIQDPCMAQRTRTYQLVENLLGSDLEQYVIDARRDGESWGAIAFDLADRTQVKVTAETLRIWFSALPVTAVAS